VKPGQKFARHRVIELKKAMLMGASDTALARIEKVAANTIRRIRLGETYADVVVEGEEALRPVIDITYVPTGPQVEQRTVVRPVELVPNDELAEMEARVLAHQEKVEQAREAVRAKDPKEELSEEEVRAKARLFGAS
jgi:hypothetical protein